MTYEELVEFWQDIVNGFLSPEEFVKMWHDATCPIDEVGIYKWDKK